MLVALLLPAVQMVRENGRQVQCLNNLKQISLAAFNYESAKGHLPGFSQFVKRGKAEYANIGYNTALRKFTIGSADVKTANDLTSVSGLSWAVVLMPEIERSDIWDSIVDPPTARAAVPMPPVKALICPSDQEVSGNLDIAGLSYSANTGGWDRDANYEFLLPKPSKPKVGDVIENGVFFDLAEYERHSKKGPKVRTSNIDDGAATTLMFVENVFKSYTDDSGVPVFGWLGGNEQQMGAVWVAPATGTAPAPTNAIDGQERIDGNQASLGYYDSAWPRFARPGSSHSSGANVAFCDGHTMYLRDDIDYVVYVQLMTPNRPSVRYSDWTKNLASGDSVYTYRNAPPLAEKDYQ